MEFWWKRNGEFFKWKMSILRVDAGSDSEDEHKMREGHFIKVKRKLLKRPDPIKNVFVTHSPIHELAIRWGVGDVQGCQWLMPYKWDSFLIGRTKLILKHQYRYKMHFIGWTRFRRQNVPTYCAPHSSFRFLWLFSFNLSFLFCLQVCSI